MKKIVIIITFVWIGFVCAISFMESWLKFQAPNITTKLGLGIGKLVFGALNKMEIVFVIIIISSMIFSIVKERKQLFSYELSISIVILIVQTFWLLPELNARAALIIQDIPTPKGYLHFLFVVLEVLKVLFLITFGLKLFNENRTLKK